MSELAYNLTGVVALCVVVFALYTMRRDFGDDTVFTDAPSLTRSQLGNIVNFATMTMRTAPAHSETYADAKRRLEAAKAEIARRK